LGGWVTQLFLGSYSVRRVVQEGWYRKSDKQKTGRVEREKRLREEALLDGKKVHPL